MRLWVLAYPIGHSVGSSWAGTEPDLSVSGIKSDRIDGAVRPGSDGR
jgi:hypothetical protein